MILPTVFLNYLPRLNNLQLSSFALRDCRTFSAANESGNKAWTSLVFENRLFVNLSLRSSVKRNSTFDSLSPVGEETTFFHISRQCCTTSSHYQNPGLATLSLIINMSMVPHRTWHMLSGMQLVMEPLKASNGSMASRSIVERASVPCVLQENAVFVDFCNKCWVRWFELEPNLVERVRWGPVQGSS